MSTSLDRNVALEYAGGGGGGGVVFEIQMGLVDRGADLAWCSQYGHEQETCSSTPNQSLPKPFP